MKQNHSTVKHSKSDVNAELREIIKPVEIVSHYHRVKICFLIMEVHSTITDHHGSCPPHCEYLFFTKNLML